jgi:hypothetical protein
LQALAAGVYFILDREMPWVTVLINMAAWCTGALFLFLLLKGKTPGDISALLAVFLILLCPLGVQVCRSFQPEALMTGAFFIALWYLGTIQKLGWKETILASLLSAPALFIKPGTMLFPLMGAFFGVSLSRRGWARTLFAPHFAVFGLLGILPGLLYSLLLIPEHFGQKLMPWLLLDSGFYHSWWHMIHLAVSRPLFLLAVAGVVMAAVRREYLGLGLLLGYAAYSMTFSYHTMTHTYYQVPVLPVTAIGLALLWERLSASRWWAAVPAAGRSWAALAGLFLVVVPFLGKGQRLSVMPSGAHFGQQSFYQDLNQTVPRGSTVLSLDCAWGLDLSYNAWLVSVPWPPLDGQRYEVLRGGNIQSAKARLDEYCQKYQASFFVITDMKELALLPDLQSELAELPIMKKSRDLLVYDLRQKRLQRFQAAAPGAPANQSRAISLY